MNDVARSIAPARPVAPPTQRPQPGRALALRDTPRGAASDREFLAPVLEILETPASPVRVIDIIASAQGKFQPTGRVKVIEPVETGRVAAIHVANDGLVKAGDVLIELDPSAAEADMRAASAELLSAEAESLRRRERSPRCTPARCRRRRSIAWPPEISRDPARARRAACWRRTSASLPRRSLRSTLRRRRSSPSATCWSATIATQKNLDRDAAGAGRHARQAGRVAVRREVRRHRRDRDPAISADPTGHPEEELASATTGLDVDRARQREGGSVVPVGSGAEARRFRAAGRGEPPKSRQG